MVITVAYNNYYFCWPKERRRRGKFPRVRVLHLLGIQRIIRDIVPVLVGTHLLRTVVVCPTAHIHLVLIAQVMECFGGIATTTPLRPWPRFRQLELEVWEYGRWFCDIRRSLAIGIAVAIICGRVGVTTNGSRSPVHQFTLGHEFVHLREGDFKRPIYPAQLFQQLFTFRVVTVIREGKES